jgi:hypothetical protein
MAWERGESPELRSVTVDLVFCGELAPIPALGFRADLTSVDQRRGRVSGVVWFADLARLVAVERRGAEDRQRGAGPVVSPR